MIPDGSLLYPWISFHSVIMKGASSCSIWEVIWRLITAQCAESERLSKAQYKEDVLIKALPSGLRVFMWKRGQNDYKSQKDWMTSRSYCRLDTVGLTQI